MPDSRIRHCQNFFGNCQIEMRKGEIFPRLQVWQPTETTSMLEPAWSMEILHRGCAAAFRTLFSLNGPCRSFHIFPDSIQLEFDETGPENVKTLNFFMNLE